MARPRVRTAELRATVLARALDLLESEGIEVVTTRRVAALSGTSPPAIYEFFGDKRGLLGAVFFEGFRMLGEQLEALPQSDDPRVDIEAVAWAFRRFGSAHPSLSEFMFARPVADFDPSREQLATSAVVRRIIVGRVKRWVRTQSLTADPVDVAHALLALMMGLAAQERGGWLGSSPGAVAQRWRRGVRALLSGFAAQRALERKSVVDVRRATTTEPTVGGAVAELKEQLGTDSEAVIVFASPKYDLDALGPALSAAFGAHRLIGCTTSGQIGATGFQADGLAATALAGPFDVACFSIDLSAVEQSIAALTPAVTAHLEGMKENEKAFGFLLVDGLSGVEEELSAHLDAALGPLPIVGGSAGDDLAFVETRVLIDGELRSGVAAMMLVRTTAAFVPVQVVHHIPTEHHVVVTAAQGRRVLEFDGRPAAEVYAELVGCSPHELDLSVFNEHPFMEVVGGSESALRAVQRIEANGVIGFHCAIAPGTELTFARSAEVMESLRSAFDRVRSVIDQPKVVLGCDCVMRRLQLEELGMDREVGEFFARQAVVGFSSYGEQVHGHHHNQTFAGIALGEPIDA